MTTLNHLGLVLLATLAAACSAAGANKDETPGSGAGPSGQPNLAGSSGSGPVLGDPGGPDDIAIGGALGAGDDEESMAETCDGKLVGYVRDFNAKSHPDFEPADFMFPNRVPGKYISGSVEPNIVGSSLGADQKPVYLLGDGKDSGTTTGEANFASWFHDVDGLNEGTEVTVQFEQDPSDPTGKKWVYDSAKTLGFFPIDGMLLGAETVPVNEGFMHNYHFTFELHTVFKYVAGQVFRFKGDDDVWVFIAGQRVVDLGGIHNAEDRTVALDDLGLTPNEEYPLDFFFAERHYSESNFFAETSLEFVKCDIVVK